MKIKGKYFSLWVGAGFAALLCDPFPTLAATAPDLGTESTYGVVSSTLTNTAAGTTINGDVCFTTGPATTPTINGTTTTPCPPQTGIDQGLALTALNTQACTFLGAGAIALDSFVVGLNPPGTFPPGCYSSGGAMNITLSTTVTLSGVGVYIFRPGGALNTGANSRVVLAGGACEADVYWAPVGATTLGANAAASLTPTFVGNILDDAGITLGHFANLRGRALAFNGTVTTDANTITVPTCAPVPPPFGVALAKAFSPATIHPGGTSTLTITLSNNNASASTLTSPLIDNLPSGMTTLGSPTTTCGGTPPTATATSVTLPIGATIPGGTPGTCSVTVGVTAPTLGSFPNTLAVGALQVINVDSGSHSNTAAASTPLIVSVGTPIPTLSEWAMIMLAALMVLFGVARIRRQAM